MWKREILKYVYHKRRNKKNVNSYLWTDYNNLISMVHDKRDVLATWKVLLIKRMCSYVKTWGGGRY